MKTIMNCLIREQYIKCHKWSVSPEGEERLLGADKHPDSYRYPAGLLPFVVSSRLTCYDAVVTCSLKESSWFNLQFCANWLPLSDKAFAF